MRAEDRFKLSRTLETLKIEQPQWKKVEDIEAAKVRECVLLREWVREVRECRKRGGWGRE